jgi:hypothetical protein
MPKSKIYYKEGFWLVDFIDDIQPEPATGIFTYLEDANRAAIEWALGDVKNVEIVGQSTR